MKKILLALLVVSSSSAFAAVPDATYTINTQLYSIDGGSKHLVSSISEIVNNDGKENPSFSSREVLVKGLKLKEEIVRKSTVVKGDKVDILNYSGTATHVRGVKTSDDGKWQSGDIQTLSFNDKMDLRKDKNAYSSSFNVDGKKYLLEMNVNKIDYIANLNPDQKVKMEDFVYLKSSQEKGEGCSTDGMASKDKNGDIVKCSDGVWK